MKNILLVISIFLVGCTPNASNMEYASSDLAGAAPSVEGVIVSKRPIQVAGNSSAIGSVGGGLAGAVVGSGFGGGRGQSLATIGGAILGGVAGNALEKGITKQKAFEYIVRVSAMAKNQKIVQGTSRGAARNYTETNVASQRLVTVIQSDEFNPGEHVFVIMAAKPRIVRNQYPQSR